MKLVGMSELDLNGVLFIHFPNEMSLEDSRTSLELMIADFYEDQCDGLADDERPELCISPFYVFCALHEQDQKRIRKLGEEKVHELALAAMEERRKRFEGHSNKNYTDTASQTQHKV